MEGNMMNEQEQIFTIILSDGTKIQNLRMNGNNFISQTEITESMFERKLNRVTFTDGITTVEHGAMELVQITRGPFNKTPEEGWWFVLRDLTTQEIFEREVRADISFMAMMADIDMNG